MGPVKGGGGSGFCPACPSWKKESSEHLWFFLTWVRVDSRKQEFEARRKGSFLICFPLAPAGSMPASFGEGHSGQVGFLMATMASCPGSAGILRG